MKKFIILIILTAFITGCATELQVIYPEKILYGIDFTPFSQKGFLITPEKYTDEYESIGLINYESKPGANYNYYKRVNPYFAVGFGQPRYLESYAWKTDTLLMGDALNEAYNICIEMGADAIINFQSERITDAYTNIKNPITITGYRITGFAIKRKDK